MTAPDPLVGATVGGYRVLARIGEGGMATVYRAQASSGQEVALKVLNPDVAGSREFVRRFQREGQTAVLLQHRSTVRTLQFGVDGRRLFIAMELIGGRDLFELLVAEVRFDQSRAVRIMAEVCDALEEAHARGIVHRDLKPENIMLYPDPAWPGGEGVKVLDFGIAKLLDSDEPPITVPGQPQEVSALTRFGSLIGTPEYIAPEQARGEPVDARSDVYSCGIVLYQLVTGEAPFSGDAPLSIVVRHVREPPRPPSTLLPGVSAELESIILRALAKQPADRWQSAAAMRDALLSVMPRLPQAKTAPPSPPRRTPARRRSSASALTIPVMELRAPAPGSLVHDDDERTNIMPDADGMRRRKPGEELPTLQNLGAKAPPMASPRVEIVQPPRLAMPPLVPLRPPPPPRPPPRSAPPSAPPSTPALVAPPPPRVPAPRASPRNEVSCGASPPPPLGPPPGPRPPPMPFDDAESAERSAVTPVRARPDAAPHEARNSVPHEARNSVPHEARNSAPPAPPRASAPPQAVETRQQPVVPMAPTSHPAAGAGDARTVRRSEERSQLMAVLLGMAIGAVLYGITIAVILVMR